MYASGRTARWKRGQVLKCAWVQILVPPLGSIVRTSSLLKGPIHWVFFRKLTLWGEGGDSQGPKQALPVWPLRASVSRVQRDSSLYLCFTPDLHVVSLQWNWTALTWVSRAPLSLLEPAQVWNWSELSCKVLSLCLQPFWLVLFIIFCPLNFKHLRSYFFIDPISFSSLGWWRWAPPEIMILSLYNDKNHRGVSDQCPFKARSLKIPI